MGGGRGSRPHNRLARGRRKIWQLGLSSSKTVKKIVTSRLSANKARWDDDSQVTEEWRKLNIYSMFTFMPCIHLDFNVDHSNRHLKQLMLNCIHAFGLGRVGQGRVLPKCSWVVLDWVGSVGYWVRFGQEIRTHVLIYRLWLRSMLIQSPDTHGRLLKVPSGNRTFRLVSWIGQSGSLKVIVIGVSKSLQRDVVVCNNVDLISAYLRR